MQLILQPFVTSAYLGGEFDWALLQEDRNRLWAARHNAYYANKTLRLNCKSVTTDVCVPISSLPEMITAAKHDIASNGLVGPIVGHVGDGNFHSMLLFDPYNAEEREKCKEVANRMALRAIRAGGTYFFPVKILFKRIFHEALGHACRQMILGSYHRIY